MLQSASHLTTMLSSAHRLLLQREGPCDGIPACGHEQRAQGPTGLTPQSSGPLLCSQVGSGYQGWGRGRSRRQRNSVERLRLGVSVTPKSTVFPAHTGMGDSRLQKQIQDGPRRDFSRLCGVTRVVSCKDPLQLPI